MRNAVINTQHNFYIQYGCRDVLPFIARGLWNYWSSISVTTFPSTNEHSVWCCTRKTICIYIYVYIYIYKLVLISMTKALAYTVNDMQVRSAEYICGGHMEYSVAGGAKLSRIFNSSYCTWHRFQSRDNIAFLHTYIHTYLHTYIHTCARAYYIYRKYKDYVYGRC